MKHITFLFLLLTCLKSSSQSNMIPAEKYLLDILVRDSVTSSTIYFPEGIDFGIKWNGPNHIIAAREKASVYFMVQGTHRVYSLKQDLNGEPALIRIDSSEYFGDNYNCMAFLHRDTLFEYGGYGFWKLRDFFTRFRPLSGDWEFVQGGNGLENSRTISWLDRENHLFYTAGRFSLNPFVSFNPKYEDSIHQYDLNTRKWTLLGKLDYEPLKTYRESVLMNTWSMPFGTGLALPNNLFVVLDYKNNRAIPVKEEVEDQLNSMRDLSTRKIQNGKSFWYYLNDSLYHLSFSVDEFKVNQMRFDSTSLDYSRAKSLFIPVRDNNSFSSALHLPARNLISGFILFGTGIIIGVWWTRKRKSSILKEKEIETTGEPQMPAFQTSRKFHDALNSVELEFLKELISYSREGKKMPASTINKLLGVSGKDPEIQKARRSNAITRINKVYSGFHGTDIILIDRIRDPYDKRSYLYFIESENLNDVTELLSTDHQDLL